MHFSFQEDVKTFSVTVVQIDWWVCESKFHRQEHHELWVLTIRGPCSAKITMQLYKYKTTGETSAE